MSHEQLEQSVLIDVKIYQEVDIENGRCRHFIWGRRRA